jgi:hypothetical protein
MVLPQELRETIVARRAAITVTVFAVMGLISGWIAIYSFWKTCSAPTTHDCEKGSRDRVIFFHNRLHPSAGPYAAAAEIVLNASRILSATA